MTRVGDRWVPVTEIPNNMPQLMTSFQGRERELDDVKGLLSRARLVTLLGMGGLGKTRLSLQVAAELTHQYPDGVWFIDLAPIRDAGLVVSEAAQVLDVMEERGRPLIQTLCTHLKTRRVLLILDNCEHLTKAAAELANAVAARCPEGVRPGFESRNPARSRRADLSGSSAAGAGTRRQRRSAAAIAGGAALHRPRASSIDPLSV